MNLRASPGQTLKRSIGTVLDLTPARRIPCGGHQLTDISCRDHTVRFADLAHLEIGRRPPAAKVLAPALDRLEVSVRRASRGPVAIEHGNDATPGQRAGPAIERGYAP